MTSEIQGLLDYFSGSKKFQDNTLFDYGEPTDSRLSNRTWEQLSTNNLLYRLRLDDRALYIKLGSLYGMLIIYDKNRTEFFHSTFYPAFSKACNMSEPDINTDIILPKIRIAVRNFMLDSLELPWEAVNLSFYARHTALLSDYEKVRIRSNIPEISFDAFLLKIKEEIKGDNYELLIEQRGTLFKQLIDIYSRLGEKLKKALPT